MVEKLRLSGVRWVVQGQREWQSQNMAQGLWFDIPSSCYHILVLLSTNVKVLCNLEYITQMLAVLLGRFPLQIFREHICALYWEHHLYTQDAHSLLLSVDKYHTNDLHCIYKDEVLSWVFNYEKNSRRLLRAVHVLQSSATGEVEWGAGT